MQTVTLRGFVICLIFGLMFFLGQKPSFAETTTYHSASTITTDGLPQYINLTRCSVTDGLTCDRALSSSFANLYFRNFGDFGIPENSTITAVKIRVTGKANTGIFVGVSQGTTYSTNCQSPSSTWTMWSLNGSNINVYEITDGSAVSFQYCLNAANIRSSNFIWRINYSGNNWSANIDNFEIAFNYAPPVTPTPTPTLTPTQTPTNTPVPTSTIIPPTPTPTPSNGPTPFLDLPWDYEAQGLTFNEAAMAIGSYFDHEYPLLSSGIDEPVSGQNSVVIYKIGKRNVNLDYSTHDGYDYARKGKAILGDPVLAAAAGIASYMNSCWACGNAILIDHGNGYQTRYYHMQKDGLITSIPGKKIKVTAGQAIGKIGGTGNVKPQGDAGAHIHFMVVHDKNGDGNFDDNIPDGLIDPFGWQSEDPDPWENYKFTYGGVNKTGSKSYYLWKKLLDGMTASVPVEGGTYSAGRFSIVFPGGSNPISFNLDMSANPVASASATLNSVGSVMQISAKDILGNPIFSFLSNFTLGIDFSQFDLSRYKTDSFSIYSSSDGNSWTKENTSIDLVNKKAFTQVNHLTYFALMGERKDIAPPTTTANLSGTKSGESYVTDVTLSLSSVDNDGGLGVDYTLYATDGTNWTTYTTPVTFSSNGSYKISYYSVDKDENIEGVRSIEFTINKSSSSGSSTTSTNSLSSSTSSQSNSKVSIEPTLLLEGKKEEEGIGENKGEVLGEKIVDSKTKSLEQDNKEKMIFLVIILGIVIAIGIWQFKKRFKIKFT